MEKILGSESCHILEAEDYNKYGEQIAVYDIDGSYYFVTIYNGMAYRIHGAAFFEEGDLWFKKAKETGKVRAIIIYLMSMLILCVLYFSADVEAYRNGTLVFYDPGDVPVTQ